MMILHDKRCRRLVSPETPHLEFQIELGRHTFSTLLKTQLAVLELTDDY